MDSRFKLFNIFNLFCSKNTIQYNALFNIFLCILAVIIKFEVKFNFPSMSTLSFLQVPSSSGPGEYRLKAEGSEVGWLSGSSFSREAKLEFKPLGPTVLVHTDKPVYQQGDVGMWGKGGGGIPFLFYRIKIITLQDVLKL